MKIYAKAGESFQQIDGDMPAGWIEMIEQRPTPEHMAQSDGTWYLPVKTLDEQKTDKKVELNDFISAKIIKGFTVNVTGTIIATSEAVQDRPLFLECDTSDQTNIIRDNAAAISGTRTEFDGWGVLEGETEKQEIRVDVDQMKLIFAAMDMHVNDNLVYGRGIKTQIDEATTEEALNAITWGDEGTATEETGDGTVNSTT